MQKMCIRLFYHMANKTEGGRLMGISEVVSCVSVIIALVSVIFTVKNSKRTDIKDVEARVAENTKLNIKLDNIAQDITEIKDEVKLYRQEVRELTERVAKVEASASQAHKRMDRWEAGHNEEK